MTKVVEERVGSADSSNAGSARARSTGGIAVSDSSSIEQVVGTDQLMHDLLMEILFEIRQVRLHLQEITNERFDQ